MFVAADLAQLVQRQLLPVNVTRSPVGKVLSQEAHLKHCWWYVLPKAVTTSPSTYFLHAKHMVPKFDW